MRLALPYTDEDEVDEMREVFASGYLTQGPKVEEFEAMVADYVGAEYAFATSSCTTAMHLCLAALGIGAGDEVLVPDFTFPATANVVIQLGATPVLVDIDPGTFNIDGNDLAVKITSRTRAIMPVHLFGLAADMDTVTDLAREHGLHVIEDAACALGAEYRGKRCGVLSDAACFSFHPRKIITTGEGGMITTNDQELAEKISQLRNHGGARHNNRWTFDAAGYNYRMSDIQGAIGVAQMRKLESLIETRQRLAKQLAESLDAQTAELEFVQLPTEPEWASHIFQAFVVLLSEEIDRDKVILQLTDREIETTLGTYALHTQPLFRRQYGYSLNDLPNSYLAYNQSLALPFYPQMTASEIEVLSTEIGRTLADVRVRR